MKQPQLGITQIAEALGAERTPTEIVNAIFEQRRSFDIAELAELLERARELQAQAEDPPSVRPRKFAAARAVHEGTEVRTGYLASYAKHLTSRVYFLYLL